MQLPKFLSSSCNFQLGALNWCGAWWFWASRGTPKNPNPFHFRGFQISTPTQITNQLGGGFSPPTQASEKYAQVKLDHETPKIRGENKQQVKFHHLVI